MASNHVTYADIISIKYAAKRAYLRKGDKESAAIIQHQIDGLRGWRRKRTPDGYTVWRSCPFCKADLRHTPAQNHKCKESPNAASA